MKIYVGNLSFKATPELLRKLFSQHGVVEDVALATDKETGKPRGFGFVFMPDPDQARAAILAMNGRELQQRKLIVSEPLPKGAAAKAAAKAAQKSPLGPRGNRPTNRPSNRPSHRFNPRRNRPS